MTSVVDKIAEIAERDLRKALIEVRLAPAYEAAVEKGIKDARAAWSDSQPHRQLAHARRVARDELARLLGWDGC
jgi:hypothetical protein